MLYAHSPKVIVIAGAPASGKSTVAERIAEECGYLSLGLDAINTRIADTLKIGIDDLRQPHPAVFKEFKMAFLYKLRENRFRDIVLEGCRISHPHPDSRYAQDRDRRPAPTPSGRVQGIQDGVPV